VLNPSIRSFSLFFSGFVGFLPKTHLEFSPVKTAQNPSCVCVLNADETSFDFLHEAQNDSNLPLLLWVASFFCSS